MDEEVLQEIVYGNEDCSCVSENDQRGGSLIPDQDETQFDGITNLMSVDDVADFLKTVGIPSKFCDIFKENYINGKEFLLLTEKEIKEMVPPIGLTKKIIHVWPQIIILRYVSAAATC